MLDTPSYSREQMMRLRRAFRSLNRAMVLLWKLGLGRLINAWPAVGGRILIIEHQGRKTGKRYLTPVNYAIVDGEIYCTAGFGPRTHWYRNAMARPSLRAWLPQGWRRARAEDASADPDRVRLMRQVIIASGFAGPLFGVDQRRYSDEQLEQVTRDYRLVHIVLEASDAIPRV